MDSESLAFLSCDTYGPWSGLRPDCPDHIWADLPEHYGARLFIYSMYGQTSNFESSWHQRTHFFRATKAHKAQALLHLAVSLAAWPFSGRSVLLGWSPSAILRRFIGICQGKDPGAVFRHHVFLATLVSELRRQNLKVLFYHHEFSPWGTAVERACRRTGVLAIAWQHFAVPYDHVHYLKAKTMGRVAPRLLLTVTQHQTHMWDGSLPCQVQYGGSRRPIWSKDQGAHHPTEQQKSERARIVFVLGVLDCGDWLRKFSERDTSYFDVLLHPSTQPNTLPRNVTLVEGTIEDLMRRYDIVVASSPTPILTLSSARYPHIRVATNQPDGTCHCSSPKIEPDSLLDVYENFEALSALASRGCHHNDSEPLSARDLLLMATRLQNDGVCFG